MPVTEVEPAVEPQKTQRTTINVSSSFAEAITEIAKDARKSVADYCDAEYLPDALPAYESILQRKLNAISSKKDGQ